MSSYRYEATSVEGFVQVLACNYLTHGYWFFVSGVVPDGKDPKRIDQKLIEKYGVAISRQGRVRRKQAGLANIHYLRFGRFWVLLATHGRHHFFESEENNLRDARRAPLKFKGYSITVKRGGFARKTAGDGPPVPDFKLRVRVQIAKDAYRELKAWFLEIATHRSTEALARELFKVPFEPYAPIRRQMLNLLRLVNRARRMAGMEPVPSKVLRFRRRIVKPFEVEAPRRALPADRRLDAEKTKVVPEEAVEFTVGKGGQP